MTGGFSGIPGIVGRAWRNFVGVVTRANIIDPNDDGKRYLKKLEFFYPEEEEFVIAYLRMKRR